MSPESVSELFARWLSAWTIRDLAALIDVYAEDCTVETPTMGTVVGKAALEEAEQKLLTLFRDIAFENMEVIADGDRLVATFIVTGTDTYGGLAGPGKPLRFPAVLLWTVRDGRVFKERRVWDFSGFLFQRVERELNDAAEVQRLLLPPGGFVGDGFEVAAASIPARTIGGDFFDYFALPDSGFAFALGDISGKGPSAALLASALLAILSAGRQSNRPGAVLKEANEATLRRAIPGKFATVVFATFSKDGRLTYSNAGHNPPLLVGGDGPRWLRTGGTFVGVFPHAEFEEETLQLQPGDRLVVYSDGITEARNIDDIEFGEDRLLSCVDASRGQAPAALVQSILETVQRFSSGTTQGDDLTVLVFARTP
jgi:steroid delta-isomerase-like uncharacterized protein